VYTRHKTRDIMSTKYTQSFNYYFKTYTQRANVTFNFGNKMRNNNLVMFILCDYYCKSPWAAWYHFWY